MTDDELRAADELLSLDGRPTLRLERRFPHPIDKVWRAVTTPEHLAVWFPSPVQLELRPGGTMKFSLGGGEGSDQATAGEVLELDPPRRFAFLWEDDRVQLDLSPDGEGTRLVLLHSFDDKPGAASFASGWDECLAALAPLLAGEPVPTPDEVQARVAAGSGVRRHEELAALFGLDRGTVTEAGGTWTIRFERQLTCPAEVAWDLFMGIDPATGAQRQAPAAGEPLTPYAAPDLVLGVVAEVERPKVLAFDVADGEPGDHLRVELVDGTGHGARLVLTATGSLDRPGERDAAYDQWGAGAVEHLAAEAAAWALARAG
jgi:uncharacterized protein YndB with AHSA1/START domain